MCLERRRDLYFMKLGHVYPPRGFDPLNNSPGRAYTRRVSITAFTSGKSWSCGDVKPSATPLAASASSRSISRSSHFNQLLH